MQIIQEVQEQPDKLLDASVRAAQGWHIYAIHRNIYGIAVYYGPTERVSPNLGTVEDCVNWIKTRYSENALKRVRICSFVH